MDSYTSSYSQFHVILFPFMSKGHTIPILHLAHLLLRRRSSIAITIFTTPANHSFIADSLAGTSSRIVILNFPKNIPQVPSGIESTDKLPSMTLFPSFALATKLMQPEFEDALESLQQVNFMVSDGFLWWTLESATKYGFPRLVFYGMSNYSVSLSRAIREDMLRLKLESDEELITVTRFPWIKVSRSEFKSTVPQDELQLEFMVKAITASKSSYGYIVNSIYELEPVFVDYFNDQGGPMAWCVGPLCLAKPSMAESVFHEKPTWNQWLDKKLERESSVLYVAFGSQVEISEDQLKEIAIGLEKSQVNFLWVIRKKEIELSDGFDFEERVKDRGIIVRDWVNQREIIQHKSIKGFLSHCGWNSVLESICAGVPILAWPMMAEQPFNAKMVVEEIKVGLRVHTCDGSVEGFVKREVLEKKVKGLMEGEKGKEVRKKAKEYAEMAKKAMEEGTGSSWRTLDKLIDETWRK
ncbi:hypothetical protein JCGZ_09624 [Jatropha curcas]|uniref:Glycosyltransferase n=1 Tax=Jatropha curcas TaxID=180498 RepID=A0A067LKY2_JATCU|nr:UDP-glycosyltransferase 90A1 [Jatropha curcas]KDP45375.1 hypothetical protein JCGZ_09624 [Jatropha curcas]